MWKERSEMRRNEGVGVDVEGVNGERDGVVVVGEGVRVRERVERVDGRLEVDRV